MPASLGDPQAFLLHLETRRFPLLAKTKTFTTDIITELKKATWPWDPKEKGMKKYKELVDSTVIVTVAMILLGGYVAGWDFIMNLLVSFMFRTNVPH